MKFPSMSIQIGKIMSIPIKLHITFLLILPLFAWIFSIQPSPFGFLEIEPALTRYFFGTIAAISLFICVILHELGHSFVAMKYGIKIKNITLMIFGGVASMESIPKAPKAEFLIALAGPSVSIILGIISLVLLNIWIIPVFGIESPFFILFNLLGWLNIVLGIFNLLPAFPMDGGRILRAGLATQMSHINATRIAVYIGQSFAVLMVIFGILIPNIFFILIAFFIYVAASEELKVMEINTLLGDVKIRDIMTVNVESVYPDMKINALLDLMFNKKHMGYPVINTTSRTVIGIVTFSDVQKIPIDKRDFTLVRDVMAKNIISIASDEGVFNALNILYQNGIGRLLVIENGVLKGIISRTDIIVAIQLLKK